ncbi:MAG: glycosyltransferase family protein [Candidatus Xenobia bacterium]
MAKLWITANSPGEIAGWLRPIVRRVKARAPELQVRVVLLPCTFASGAEARVASQIPGVDEVVPVAEFGRLLKGGEAPAAIMHLGGDLMYTAFLVRQFHCPAWAYQWGRRQWDRYFTGYMVKLDADRERLLGQGIPARKIHVTGDLVVDSVDDSVREEPAAGGATVTFLPGSRSREARVLLPFFLEAASRIQKARPDVTFQAMLSPFLELKDGTLSPNPRLGGVAAMLEGERLRSQDGTEIRLLRQHSLRAVEASRLVVSIPGTKTAEAACLGTPPLVVMPTNLPEDIPSIGLVGLLDYVPLVGRWLKGKLVTRMLDRIGYLAQPNILAQRALVPEMKGILSPAGVAQRVLELIAEEDSLVRMGGELKALYEPFRGAADRLVQIVLQELPETPAPLPVSAAGER